VVVKAEIMVPLVGTVREFNAQAAVIRATAEQASSPSAAARCPMLLGTMIETPRAALVADSIGAQAQFFSFGTNDLTQMTMGFSRDDAGKFLPSYLKQGIYEHDPFRSIDQKGVGLLVRWRSTRAARRGPTSSSACAASMAATRRRWPSSTRRAGLRELQPVPRADRAAGGGAGGGWSAGAARRWTSRAACGCHRLRWPRARSGSAPHAHRPACWRLSAGGTRSVTDTQWASVGATVTGRGSTRRRPGRPSR
jgi:hypothetical protein